MKYCHTSLTKNKMQNCTHKENEAVFSGGFLLMKTWFIYDKRDYCHTYLQYSGGSKGLVNLKRLKT